MVRAMDCMSLSHKMADTKVREQFALNDAQQEAFLTAVRENTALEGCVLLMTCNRCEIYYEGEPAAGGHAIEQIFMQIKSIDTETLRSRMMRYEGRGALVHLYQVVCGLDSAVLGEVEIIRQVRQAYGRSAAGGLTGARLNIIFQSALQFAKEVADQSLLTKLPVSVGTLTTGAALSFCEKISVPHILLVGAAGEMGSIVRRDLLDADEQLQIVGTSRKHRADEQSFQETERMHWIHYDRRYEYLDWADVVISVTNSPHYTFLADRTGQARHTDKPLLFLDLAVPRDIDEDIDDINGCTVQNMDYIRALAAMNNQKKIREAKRVGWILEEKVAELEKALLFREYMESHEDTMQKLHQKPADWLVYHLKEELDLKALQQLLDTIGQMV